MNSIDLIQADIQELQRLYLQNEQSNPKKAMSALHGMVRAQNKLITILITKQKIQQETKK